MDHKIARQWRGRVKLLLKGSRKFNFQLKGWPLLIWLPSLFLCKNNKFLHFNSSQKNFSHIAAWFMGVKDPGHSCKMMILQCLDWVWLHFHKHVSLKCMALTQCLFINTFFVNLTGVNIILSENKQDYTEMLNRNFTQCVVQGIQTFDILPLYIYTYIYTYYMNPWY